MRKYAMQRTTTRSGAGSMACFQSSSSSSSATSLFRFLLLVVISCRNDCNLVCFAQETGGSACTLCADGSTPSGTYPGGLDCSVVAESIGATPAESSDCRDTQISAVEYCSCGTLPEGLCPLCSDRATLEFPNLPLPDRNATCRSIAFPTECQNKTYNAAWYCGCSNAGSVRPIANASICGQDDIVPTHTNRILPSDLATTCLQYDRSQGVGVLGEGVDTSPVGDLPAYCGCSDASNVPISPTCSMCEGGAEVLYPNRIVVAGTSTTCMQLQTLANYIVDESYCTTMKQNYAMACCQATQAPVTLAPAPPTPVATATAPIPVASTPTTTTPPPVAMGASAALVWGPNVGLASILNSILFIMLR